jgi:hypothetical protein
MTIVTSWRWFPAPGPSTPPRPNSSFFDPERRPRLSRERPQPPLIRPRPRRPASRLGLLLKPFPFRGVLAHEGGGLWGESENHVLNHPRPGRKHANEMPRRESEMESIETSNPDDAGAAAVSNVGRRAVHCHHSSATELA